jgi:hypothetical protein
VQHGISIAAAEKHRNLCVNKGLLRSQVQCRPEHSGVLYFGGFVALENRRFLANFGIQARISNAEATQSLGDTCHLFGRHADKSVYFS